MDLLEARTKVLVVDDSKLIRVAAQRVLKDEYQVLMVEDGEKAWELINQDDEIRVVFSDIVMPNLDGFSLLKRVRQSDQQRISQLPLIIMTTDDDDESRRTTALNFGATDFISKPFNSTDLKARAKAHVTSENLARELQQKAAQLELNASKDLLTGLCNKSYLLDKLWQDHSYAFRYHTPLTVVRLDVEEFNQVFIHDGKSVANHLVKAIANIISSQLRSEDTAARIGLSSFIVVFPGADIEETRRRVNEVHHNVENTKFEVSDEVTGIHLSSAILAPALNTDTTVDLIMQLLDEMSNQVLSNPTGRIIVENRQTEITGSIADSSEHSRLTLDQLLEQVIAGRESEYTEQIAEAIDRIMPLLACADKERQEKLQRLLDSTV